MPRGTKGAVRPVAPVSKDLAGHGQADGVGGLDHLAAGERQQHRAGRGGLHRTADGRRQRRVFRGHIVQCAVGLDVVQRHARRVAEGFQCANLIHHIGLGFCRGYCHFTAAKALQIGQAGMRTDLYAVFFAQQNALLHDGRIARVEAAGDVGACHIGQDLGVHADGVCAEALAQIAVQINGWHCKAPFKISAPCF